MAFIESSLTNMGIPAIVAYGVYIGEIIAPLMMIAGVYTRLAAIIVFINMIFAIVLAHMGDIFSLNQHGGWAIELQAFYLLVGLAIAMTGSGRYAVKPD